MPNIYMEIQLFKQEDLGLNVRQILFERLGTYGQPSCIPALERRNRELLSCTQKGR